MPLSNSITARLPRVPFPERAGRLGAPLGIGVAVIYMSLIVLIPFAALIWCLRTNGLRGDVAGAAFIGALWALPFGLGILSQTQGVPLLPLVLMGAFAWLVAEALDWRRFSVRSPAKA